MVRCLDLSRGCSHADDSVRAAVSGLSTISYSAIYRPMDKWFVITSRRMHPRETLLAGRGGGRAWRRRLTAASRLRPPPGGSSPTGRSRTDARPPRTTRCRFLRCKGCAHDPQGSGHDSPSCDESGRMGRTLYLARICQTSCATGSGTWRSTVAQKFWGMYRTGGVAPDRTRLWAACSSL
jgi:hypothetical protein